jgi:hypothetical protein
LVLFARSGRRPAVRELVLVCVFLPPACGSVRMIGWWLLAVAPILAGQLGALLPQPRPDEKPRPSVGAAAFCVLLLAAMVLSLPWFERVNPVFLASPARAHRTETDLQTVADRLRETGSRGNLFTRFAWGEYLGWSLSPDYPVFMDARIEIYPDDVWAQYDAVTRGRADWQRILDRYGVVWLVLDGRSGYHAGLLEQVRRSPDWEERPDLEAGDVVVFRRVSGS